jgi:hypothetical protein
MKTKQNTELRDGCPERPALLEIIVNSRIQLAIAQCQGATCSDHADKRVLAFT